MVRSWGDYWVLDHADDYSWSIVGEGSGGILWLLSRRACPRRRPRGAGGAGQGAGL
ncbi:lipocalin family protein [Caulobacter segnis]